MREACRSREGGGSCGGIWWLPTRRSGGRSSGARSGSGSPEATPADQLDPGATAGVAAEGGPGEDLGRRLARQRMRHELDRMRELGASVSGEIGVADPVDAVRVVLHRWEFDEVILSTLPGRRSRWLAADLPTKIRRGFKLQVTQVTGATAANG